MAAEQVHTTVGRYKYDPFWQHGTDDLERPPCIAERLLLQVVSVYKLRTNRPISACHGAQAPLVPSPPLDHVFHGSRQGKANIAPTSLQSHSRNRLLAFGSIVGPFQ